VRAAHRAQAALIVGVALAGLVGCQGAEAYYRYAKQPSGSGGAPGALDADNPSFKANDGSIDVPGNQDAIDGADVAEASLPAQDAAREVDGEVGCGLCALDVMYWCEGTAANTIRATFSLVNDTEGAIPLREVTIRYWFTGGPGASPWEFACDVGTVGVQAPPPPRTDVTAAVTNVFRMVRPARPGADMYFEVGFTAAAGDLPPGYYSLFRTRVYRMDYSNIAQTDDYSYNAKNITFGPSPHITLYRNGQLLSGVEPPLK
jgi:hypothetical protein